MNSDGSSSGVVTINIDHAEALVLFDLLSRELESRSGERLRQLVQRDGELWALNSLQCVLERELADAFHPEYAQHVERANATVEQEHGAWNK